MTTIDLPETLLFDLDGTLVDSGPGILGALNRAFALESVEPLAPQVQRALLGPPLYRSLPPLLGDDWQRVFTTYRRVFADEGYLYQAEVYPGVEPLLTRLTSLDVRMAVATSKSEMFAVPLLEKLGLADHFATICGDTPDAGRPTKAAVIAEVAQRLTLRGTAVMVGDREHDVVGAREHGLGCVGAGWGYGTRDELVAAGAIAVLDTPGDLAAAWGLY
jgi:phosphoglycolate phosphatase